MGKGNLKEKLKKFRAKLPKLTGTSLTFGGIGVALEFSDIPNFENEMYTFILIGIKYASYAMAIYKYGMDNKESDKPAEMLEAIKEEFKIK